MDSFYGVAAALGGVGTVVLGIVSVWLGLRLRADRAARQADFERIKRYVGEQIVNVSNTVQTIRTTTVVLEQELHGHHERLNSIAQQFDVLERDLVKIQTSCVRHGQQDQRDNVKELAGKIGKLFDRLDSIKDELRSDRFVTAQQYQRDLDNLTNNIDALRSSLSDAMALLKAALKRRG